MINNKRDIERFRQIAKPFAKDSIAKDSITTIDNFDYIKESVTVNTRYLVTKKGLIPSFEFVCAENIKNIVSIDEMLKNIKSIGIYKNYSIDRTTNICTTPMERAVVRTTVAEEI